MNGMKRMLTAGGIVLLLAGAAIIWLSLPSSPVKAQFRRDVAAELHKNRLQGGGEAFTEADFAHLPEAVQAYIKSCGYIGAAKMSWLGMEYRDVAFSQGRGSTAMTIDYAQYNFVSAPCRLAVIDSRLFGIPFEGYDYYRGGQGGMKGVLAKAITLFDQNGADMDRACLVTFLAESMFAPSILLQDYITLEELNEHQVRASITYGGQTASGIFTFNARHEMTAFTTNDRAATAADGSMEYVPWSALCTEYKTAADGIRRPTRFQAVWNYPDGDFTYFDGAISAVTCG